MNTFKSKLFDTFLFVPSLTILFCLLFLVFFWSHIFLSFICLILMFLSLSGTLLIALIRLLIKDKPKKLISITTFVLTLIIVGALNIIWTPNIPGKIKKTVDTNLVHLGFQVKGYHPTTFGFGGSSRCEDVLFSPLYTNIKTGYLYSKDPYPDANVELYKITDLEHIKGDWYLVRLEYV